MDNKFVQFLVSTVTAIVLWVLTGPAWIVVVTFWAALYDNNNTRSAFLLIVFVPIIVMDAVIYLILEWISKS